MSDLGSRMPAEWVVEVVGRERMWRRSSSLLDLQGRCCPLIPGHLGTDQANRLRLWSVWTKNSEYQDHLIEIRWKQTVMIVEHSDVLARDPDQNQ